jgi:outer membrane protein assembly factor BamA
MLLALSQAARAAAQPAAPGGDATRPAAPSSDAALPTLRPAPELGELRGRKLSRIEVVSVGGRWTADVRLTRVRTGEELTPELARRALRELADTGRFASVAVEVEANGSGVVMRLIVVPRRVIAALKLAGGTLDDEETLREAGVRAGGEITAPELPRVADRVRRLYARRGFPRARVWATPADTEDPLRVVVRIDVEPGEPRRVAEIGYQVSPTPLPELLEEVAHHAVERGDPLDEDRLTEADRALERRLRAHGWHRAGVTHATSEVRGLGARLTVKVAAGPRIVLRFEGNRRFGGSEIESFLDLEAASDRSEASIAARTRDFYVARGFLDASVASSERGAPEEAVHELWLSIREGRPVRVATREFPCLSGPRDADEVGSEIDSFLSEELPGSGIVGPVDPALVDRSLGPGGPTGARPAPFELNPWKTYEPRVYERAMKHVQDLYRSEGYLSATVGPVALLRRRCDPRSPSGQCRPLGRRRRPAYTCAHDDTGRPLEEPAPDPADACTPDPASGVSCEPQVVLSIPVKLGPRALLWDLAFEGNRVLVEADLEELTELEPGAPVSQIEIDKARRRLLDAYAEEGFAFAEVDSELELSPDRTRARVRFLINEREQVRVAGILVRGARRTKETLVLGRAAFDVGEPYRRSDVRKTEERLATLGVFSSVSVGLEDPHVPAREKWVVISVQERPPQYLDVRPGFSTGEGLRVAFEYGHRNLGGGAIRLTLRVQLGYLPDAFILEEDVREKFQELALSERLERRNTASVEFPEIGLGPLFRLGVDGVELRDNARDFGITRRAGIVTLIYRPNRRFSAQLGGSVELNDAQIFGFGEEDRAAFEAFLRTNPIPEGQTLAVAQRTGFTWDRRDNPFSATSGTLLGASVEHVNAFAIEEAPETIDSEFLRFSNRLAGYVPVGRRGLTLAASFRWGYNQQLTSGSQTYPDRLFFLGGVDSLRGFLQDSVVPEDIAQELLAQSADRRAELLSEVVIRGGNVLVNPRLELRIPLGGIVQTALFLDSGNLWLKPEEVEPYRLRYAAGSGLRAGTPIGPLAFDYGVNLYRRPWEDFGAFHFSVGLF